MIKEKIEVRLEKIETMLNEQKIIQKEILSFKDACVFLNLSSSNLYKLTSKKEVPHYCPQGKKLYFDKVELISWLKSNKVVNPLNNSL